MPADLKYLSALLLSMLACTLGFLFFPEARPEKRQLTCDVHLQYFFEQCQKEERPREVVFLGSSQTMNAVHAPYIRELFEQDGLGVQVHNLGVNWFGLDLQHVLLSAWLEHHQPLAVVLEVPYLYRYKLHPNFSKVAEPEQIFDLMGFSFPRALVPAFGYGPRVLYQQWVLSQLEASPSLSDREEHLGTLIVNLPEEKRLENLSRDRARLAMGMKKIPAQSRWKRRLKDVAYRHHEAFLKKSVDLCRARNIPVILLVVPRLQLNDLSEDFNKRYQALAPVWCPPEKLLQRPGLWRDINHLNTKGSEVFSQWLADQIKPSLKKEKSSGNRGTLSESR